MVEGHILVIGGPNLKTFGLLVLIYLFIYHLHSMDLFRDRPFRYRNSQI